MRVVMVDRFGGPEVLVEREVPDPVPGPGAVVVDVVAADTLWVETMIRRGEGGRYFPVRPPYRAGCGVAGTVSSVGAGVDPSWTGRRVVTRTGEHGGYVERALVPAESLVPVPEGVGLVTAAALLHDGTTAFALADLVPVGPGDRVLVTAAAGGLGVILVQLARAAGARVVAAARGAGKLDRLRALGADLVVDYSAPDWADRVRAATGGLDVVFDGAGGDYGRAAYQLVVPGGRFSAHGRPAGSFAVPGDADARARAVAVTGIDDVRLDPATARRHTAQALVAASAGEITPLVGQTFPLSRAADAHAAIESRTAVGKTLLLP